MAVEYVVELFSDSATFGPNTKLAEVWDARNLGWSRLDRLPGKAFLTLAQTSPILPLFDPLVTHIAITRVAPSGNKQVFAGEFIDYDSTGDDVVLDFCDYTTLLGISRTGYRQLYPSKLIGTEIVSPEWAKAKGVDHSPVGFVATGTIEDPVGTDGTTKIKVNQTFGLLDQMRLQVFYDLSEIGRANTTNQVTYEITREAPYTFNFWKNKGSNVDMGLVLNGNVSDYNYLPNWTRYRNDLATIGTTVGGGATEISVSDSAQATARGRRQDVFVIKTLLGIAGSATEADQQTAVANRQLKRAVQHIPALALRILHGTIEPFVGWDINDYTGTEVVNGIDNLTGNWRMVGARATYSETGEDVQIIVEPLLT